jgi:hypothetical protein
MDARRHKLIVREFERKAPGAYRANVAMTTSSSAIASTSSTSAKSERAPKPAAIKPPSPGADRKPTTLETQLKRKRARLDALKWLRATFPGLFYGDPKPLAIGAGKTIVARAIDSGHWPSRGKARDSVGAAICYFTGSIAYLTELSEPGAMRHGLDAAPLEPVSEEHRVEAVKLLAARRAAISARQAALKASASKKEG